MLTHVKTIQLTLEVQNSFSYAKLIFYFIFPFLNFFCLKIDALRGFCQKPKQFGIRLQDASPEQKNEIRAFEC